MYSELCEENLLPKDIDLKKFWIEAEEKDKYSICPNANSKSEYNSYNMLLAKQMGVDNYLVHDITISKKLLDIGCGYGAIRELLKCNYYCQNIEYVGVDVIKRIDECIEVSGNGELPFTNESFHFITSSNVFQHVHEEHRLRYIEESYRILVPSGRLIISTYLDFTLLFEHKMLTLNNRAHTFTYNKWTPHVNIQEVYKYCDIGFSLISLTNRFDKFTTLVFIKK